MAYHINAKGEAGLCRARSGNCPFGGESEHYSTPDEAREAYEAQQSAIFPAAGGRRQKPRGMMADVEEGNYIYLQNGEHGFVMEVHKTPDRVAVVIESSNGRTTARLPFDLKPTTVVEFDTVHMSLRQVRQLNGAHPLSAVDGYSSRAHQVAKQATAYISPDAVLETQMEGDSATLLMKNSHAAHAADEACRQAGWITEIEHLRGTDMKLIRVIDPDSTRRCFVNTKNLMWSPESRSYVAEASELRDFKIEDFNLVSQKNGASAKMELVETMRNEHENETLGWVFKPVGNHGDWQVTVYND